MSIIHCVDTPHHFFHIFLLSLSWQTKGGQKIRGKGTDLDVREEIFSLVCPAVLDTAVWKTEDTNHKN